MTNERYQELLQVWGSHGTSNARSFHWSRIARKLNCSVEEAKEFGLLLINDSSYDPSKFSKSKSRTSSPKQVKEDISPQDHKYAHESPYWYDPDRKVYVIWLPHLTKPLALPAHMWSGIKAAYSQWNGNPSSVEELARKFGLTRRTVTSLLRVMNHTHTGSPWTREQVAASEDKALVEDLILAREERVLRQAETHNWNSIKSKAESWDLLQKGSLDALNSWLSAPSKDYVSKIDYSVQDLIAPQVAVLGLTDLHYGSLGHDAPSSVWKTLNILLRRWERRGFPERIVLPIGSDGMHFDTSGYTTTGGTRMEVEGKARDTIIGYMEFMADLIHELSNFAPVYCFPMAGNHDRMMSYATFGAMRLAFASNDRVSFSNSLSEVQVFVHGKTFVSFNHGDKHKPSDLAGILPRDFAPQWGQTENRYCLLGHYHTSGTFGSKTGLESIYMPSLAPPDEWTESQGFRSTPSLSVYTFDAIEGLITVDTIRVSKES